MRRTVGFLVIVFQLLIVGLFFGTIFNKEVNVKRHVATIHNDNLDKIATSVSLLFEDEELNILNQTVEDTTLKELPSVDLVEEVVREEKELEKEEEVISTPLVSVDAEKYINNIEMGFRVTEDNKGYSLSDYEFNVVVAVVAGEFDRNLNDALAVVSVILNRCDSDKWISFAGSTPYDQVIRAGQFEVYSGGTYLQYMPGGSNYGSEKYNIAKQAVNDGLNGIRNNEYLGFRAWWISGYSDKYIITGGNRYGYN